MELREWQKNAIAFFFEKNKAILNVPTGAGKTFAAISILKKVLENDPNIRILIVMPKLVIIEGWKKELIAMGFHFHQIGIVSGECKEFSKITLTTINSVYKLDMRMFDFIIADEIHNMGTPRMLKILKNNFKYKLGLTATPTRSDFNHWKIFEAFDFCTFEYSIKEAMKDEVLNKYEFYDIVIDLEPKDREIYEEISMSIATTMKRLGGYHRFMSLPNTNKDKLLLMKLINKRKVLIWNHPSKLRIVTNIAKEFHLTSKMLIFSQYNSVTNALYYYLGSENIKSMIIHSNIPDKDKKSVLFDYKHDKFNILLATKMLDEGYNLPSIDIGVILAGESTHRQTIQRLGRVLRKKDSPSKLFQLYIKDTFEEKSSKERSDFFKMYCIHYEKVNAEIEDDGIELD